MSVEAALARARAALASIHVAEGSPYAAAEARVLNELGLAPRTDASDGARLAFWEGRQPGSRVGDDRYRWEVSHRHMRPTAHAGDPATWRSWRPDIERDAERAEIRISLPLSLSEHADYLLDVAAGGGPHADQALRLLEEADPLFRRDLTPYIQALHPWGDTFALFLLARRPRALERVHSLAVAMAMSQAAMVQDGAVRGWQFPFHDVALPSASAQLAGGLFALGLAIPTLAELVRFVKSAMSSDGAWTDELPPALRAKFPRLDVLATFAAVDLLAHIDPSFDHKPSIAALLSFQQADGMICAMGPERVWLTGEVVRLATDEHRRFADRFRFPAVLSGNRDRKTGLPFYAHFDDLAHLFAAVDGIAKSDVPLAFIDLAGFRDFNNTHGQDRGDDVLAGFAQFLCKVSAARVVRDGGDEFLVVGAPTRGALEPDLDRFRRAWPARFRELFGSSPPVVPRILVTSTRAGDLRRARETLGRALGAVKEGSQTPPEEGVLQSIP
ncbi:hypothetical protein BH09MYX1_BH09MYX1_50440 [soil metagenome]